MFDLQGYGWMLWAGLKITLLVGLSSLAVAFSMGLLGSWGKLSEHTIARALAETYTTVIRGIPELILILTVYYGTPTLIQTAADYLGYNITIDFNPFVSGVLTLGIIYGAFATEVFRGAYLAIPRGEIEAAQAFGMSRATAFRRIVLPQMLRFALPGLGNIWMTLIKSTALVSVIQLKELMYMAYVAVGATRLPFTFFFITSLMYLSITVLSMLGQEKIEAWANRGIRRD